MTSSSPVSDPFHPSVRSAPPEASGPREYFEPDLPAHPAPAARRKRPSLLATRSGKTLYFILMGIIGFVVGLTLGLVASWLT